MGLPAMLGGRQAVSVFVAFALAYFFSALLRAITATLAPVFSEELGLGAAQLGLLAGAYFLGFSAMQLPLGKALDGLGPKRVVSSLLVVAIVGCAAFALARNMAQMFVARVVIGVGVSACLMAPLTLFRQRFSSATQSRANSWMLMTGSLGMLASTLPAQWLLPLVGWRGLFALVAALLVLSLLLIRAWVPVDATTEPAATFPKQGYWCIFRTPTFLRLVPVGFFSYGGMVAMQSLWIGPWLTNVGQRSPSEAASGLFLVNGCMLVAFLCWGLGMPRLLRLGWNPEQILSWGWLPGLAWLAFILWCGPAAGALEWSIWCVLTSTITLSQPAIAQMFPAELAGRALSAFNLVIFLGVFVVQWGLGVMIDAISGWGLAPLQAYRSSFGVYLGCCGLSFLWMRWWPAGDDAQ